MRALQPTHTHTYTAIKYTKKNKKYRERKTKQQICAYFVGCCDLLFYMLSCFPSALLRLLPKQINPVCCIVIAHIWSAIYQVIIEVF